VRSWRGSGGFGGGEARLIGCGLLFASVYVAASAALFVGSWLGFVVLLVFSQLVAVRMLAARRRVMGADASGGDGDARLGEIVGSVLGRAKLCRALPVVGDSAGSGDLATIATASQLVSHALADRDTQCVVAFYRTEVEAVGAWRAAPDPRLELVSVDWLGGSVRHRMLHR
jgi:predicted lipid-binding transport protein (Tim44 family)